MLRWSESARFWIVVGCINITIPVVVILKTRTKDLNRGTANLRLLGLLRLSERRVPAQRVVSGSSE